MNVDDIKKRVAEIYAKQHDGEAAHELHDALLKDFVQYVANSGQDPFCVMASEILKADDIDYPRFVA